MKQLNERWWVVTASDIGPETKNASCWDRQALLLGNEQRSAVETNVGRPPDAECVVSEVTLPKKWVEWVIQIVLEDCCTVVRLGR